MLSSTSLTRLPLPAYLTELGVEEGLFEAAVHGERDEDELVLVPQVQGRGRHELPDLPPHLTPALPQVGRQVVDEHTHEQHGQHGDADVHAHHGPHLSCDVTSHGPFDSTDHF